MDKEKYLEELNQLPWDDIYPTLIAYAHALIKYRKLFFKHGIDNKSIARSAVQDSITRLFEREKDWNPEVYPEATDKLKSMIGTYFSNLFKSKHYRDTIRFENDDTSDEDTIDLMDILFSSEDPSLQTEAMERASELHDKCLDFIDGDEDLTLLFFEMIDGKQNQEIAKSLDWDIKKVESTKKKIRRRLLPIKQEINKQ